MRPLIPIVLLAAALAAAAAEPTRIDSAYDPDSPVDIVTIAPLWRITDDEDGGDILGEIGDVACDRDGRSYLLDLSFHTLRVVGPAGEPLGTLGREGDGPGEFRNPEDCLVLGDGRVGVSQVMPGRIITLQPTGEPGEPVALPGEGGLQVLLQADAAADAVYVCSSAMIMNEGGLSSVIKLQSLDLDGTPRAVFKEQGEQMQLEDGRAAVAANSSEDFTRFWAVGADGRLYVAPRSDAYEIEVYAPDGTLERVLAVAYEHVRRTDEEIARIEADRAGVMAHVDAAAFGEIDPYRRDIDRLHPRPDGTLWVASSRGDRDRPDGTVGAFDVFDRGGRLVRRLALGADFDPVYDDYVIAGDRLYVLEEVLGAPASSPSVGGEGAMVVRLGQRRAPVDEDREPQPYAVACYDLSGI